MQNEEKKMIRNMMGGELYWFDKWKKMAGIIVQIYRNKIQKKGTIKKQKIFTP